MHQHTHTHIQVIWGNVNKNNRLFLCQFPVILYYNVLRYYHWGKMENVYMISQDYFMYLHVNQQVSQNFFLKKWKKKQSVEGYKINPL